MVLVCVPWNISSYTGPKVNGKWSGHKEFMVFGWNIVTSNFHYSGM